MHTFRQVRYDRNWVAKKRRYLRTRAARDKVAFFLLSRAQSLDNLRRNDMLTVHVEGPSRTLQIRTVPCSVMMNADGLLLHTTANNNAMHSFVSVFLHGRISASMHTYLLNVLRQRCDRVDADLPVSLISCMPRTRSELVSTRLCKAPVLP